MGDGLGHYFALALSILVLMGAVFRGGVDVEFPGGPTVAFGGIVVLYLLGGIGSGIVVGLLRRWLHYLPLAVLVGMMLAVPVTIGMDFLLYGVRLLSAAELRSIVSFAIVWGGASAAVIWYEARRAIRA